VAVTKPITITSLLALAAGTTHTSRGSSGTTTAAITLRVNAVTVRNGSVAAELIDWSATNTSQLPDIATAPPMPGFALADCDVFARCAFSTEIYSR
jgi:hypothetical protein